MILASQSPRRRELLGLFCPEFEVMPAQGDSYAMKVTEIRNQNGETVASAPHPQELLQVKFEKPVKKFDMLRKRPSDVK